MKLGGVEVGVGHVLTSKAKRNVVRIVGERSSKWCKINLAAMRDLDGGFHLPKGSPFVV